MRLPFLFLFTAALFSILAGRLFFLQIVQADYYQALATEQRQRSAQLQPHRGTIYVSEGKNHEPFPIAVNRTVWRAYAVPRDMPDPHAVAEALAPALFNFRQRQTEHEQTIIAATGQPAKNDNSPEAQGSVEEQLANLKDELMSKFDRKTDPYEPFLRLYEVLDDDFKKFLDEHHLPGIRMESVEARFYPEKTLAAHALGYVGWQDEKQRGFYGIEGYFEPKLTGQQGFVESEKAAGGQLIGVGERTFRPAKDGTDLILTIDRVVQSFIETELKEGVTRYGAERGSIVVMQPKTGAILGMATYPTFDPNYYFAVSDPRVQVNPVVSDLFEPGSILKPVVIATALDKGIVTPDTTMIDSGPVKVADYTINTYDGRHHGKQTMTQILEQSNNIGMVWVGQQLGAETMYDYFRRFGLGEKTGVELEGETQNTLLSPNKWNITTVATASFGQGVALTPLHALNAINALANSGQLPQPYLIHSARYPDGHIELTEPTMVRRAVSPQTAEQVSAMLVSVIENGVAQLARVPGYYLAGKTGTAQVPDARGKYDPNRKIISFVGYGPVRDPQFSILIKLDNPTGLSFASGTAAPMFRHVAEKLLNYYQIPPDYQPK